MSKLISMCDFVLEQSRYNNDYQFSKKVCRYAEFLKQPLGLWMFIPCDENSNILEEPKKPWQDNIMGEGLHLRHKEDFRKYQQAKDRCLFEGFDEIDAENILSCIGWHTVEELANNGVGLKLTKTAIKKIGL